MNTNQIKWAMSHDWYIKNRTNSEGNTVVIVRCDMVANHTQSFTDFEALRQWAGY